MTCTTMCYKAQVAPLKSITYALSLAALECGQMPMPHVKAIWERSKTTVFEFGTHNVPKHIFIRPVGRGEQMICKSLALDGSTIS